MYATGMVEDFVPTRVRTFALKENRDRLWYRNEADEDRYVKDSQGEWGHEIVKDQPPKEVPMTQAEVVQAAALRQALADLMPFVEDTDDPCHAYRTRKQVAIEAARKILEETK